MFPSRVPLGKNAEAAPRVCQRCEKPGHAIYECKNPRPYKSRPTRSQVLKNPALAEKPPSRTTEIRRPGLATEILEEREKARKDSGRYETRSRSSSVSSTDSYSSHPSSCSTCTPMSPREEDRRSRSPSPIRRRYDTSPSNNETRK